MLANHPALVVRLTRNNLALICYFECLRYKSWPYVWILWLYDIMSIWTYLYFFLFWASGTPIFSNASSTSRIFSLEEVNQLKNGSFFLYFTYLVYFLYLDIILSCSVVHCSSFSPPSVARLLNFVTSVSEFFSVPIKSKKKYSAITSEVEQPMDYNWYEVFSILQIQCPI